MDHITYHPVGIDTARTFASLTLKADGIALATNLGIERKLDQASTDQLLQLQAHYALRSDLPFDQTHGFAIAAIHGLFDTYYYIEGGSLSALGDLIAPYAQTWQTIVVDHAQAENATNRLSANYSSGVYLAPNMIAQFMADTHAIPELTAALAFAFPGEKAHVLWAALQRSLDMGVGLLEARGVLVPSHEGHAGECHTAWTNCDPSTLPELGAIAAAEPTTAGPVVEPAAMVLATDNPVAPAPLGECQEGGLAARLHAKRMAPQRAAAATEAETEAMAFNAFVNGLTTSSPVAVPVEPIAFEDILSYEPTAANPVPAAEVNASSPHPTTTAAAAVADEAALPTGWEPYAQIHTEAGTPVMRYQEPHDGIALRIFAVA